MSSFSKGFQSFLEGFDWKLISDYWRGIREHAWEIFWGSGVPGIAFTIYTLYYAPARAYLPWAVAWAILVAGYFIWRADHIRLVKRIELRDVRVVVTPTKDAQTGNPGADRAVVQLSVECASEVSVEGCVGRLVSAQKWEATENKWKPTNVDEPLTLIWSVTDTLQRSLEIGVPLRLNIFYVDNVPQKWIRVCTDRIPFRMERVFIDSQLDEVFKFDISVTGSGCLPATASYRVQFGGEWDKPIIERL